MIKVSDGKNKTYKYKKDLKAFGLIFKYTSKDTGFWYKEDDKDYNKIFKFCNKHGLRIEKEDIRYSRSATYREDFLRENKGYKHDGKTYHCAYCGKKIMKENMEVDHLLSVNKAKKSILARLYLKLSGIKNVNSTKNLVASCKRCNRKKSDKEGLWYIRGILGRHIWFWRILRICFAILIIFIIYLTITNQNPLYYINILSN